MGCGASNKINPKEVSLIKSDNTNVSTKKKQEIVVVVIDKSDNRQWITECLESLKKECAQHHVEQYPSFDVAFRRIQELSADTKVILIIAGNSFQNLKDKMPHTDSLPLKIRNLFVYSSENELTEKPTTSLIQYVSGKRHLLSAIRDTLDAVNASPTHKHTDQYVSITIHQSTFNELLKSIKSVQFKVSILTIKVSQMKVILSPSLFEFIAHAEVIGAPKMFSRYFKQQVHGECELILDKAIGKLILKIKKLIIELPKVPGIGGGPTDISGYSDPFPLEGFVDFAHPFDLPDNCETKRLAIIPRDIEFVVEEQRVIVSVLIHYAEFHKEHK